jgi:CRISPR/Cas system-associated protein endoribonuclease Cas2
MFGYPWETEQDAKRTLQLCHYLLRKGYLQTAQASLYCPQGVPGNEAHKKFVKKIYNVGYDPRFWFSRIRSLHEIEDIKYLLRGIKAWSQS